MTAKQLRAELTRLGCNPRLEGAAIVVDAIPLRLAPAFSALTTGLKSLLRGETWYGGSLATGRAIELQTDELLPGWVDRLMSESDGKWHHLDRPPANIFALAPKRTGGSK